MKPKNGAFMGSATSGRSPPVHCSTFLKTFICVIPNITKMTAKMLVQFGRGVSRRLGVTLAQVTLIARIIAMPRKKPCVCSMTLCQFVCW